MGRLLRLQAMAVALVIGALGGGTIAAATGTLPISVTSDRPTITRSSASASSSPAATSGARGAGQVSEPAV